MSTYLYTLGRLVIRRRRVGLGVWVVLLVGVTALAVGGGGKTIDNFTGHRIAGSTTGVS